MKVVTTWRTKKSRRIERVQALGPATMGQPLSGEYDDLHGSLWALTWYRDTGLQLEQVQGGAWVAVQPGQAFPVLPRTARHLSLAFDQTARHVFAWEDLDGIRVRQWDQTTNQYAYVGPFPGCDPLLFTDTTASRYTPDSDVLLIHLNAARTAAVYRLQRDGYSVEYPMAAGLTDAVLDQSVPLLYNGQIYGESGGSQLLIDLGLYPARSEDVLVGLVRLTGSYEAMTVARSAVDGMVGTVSLRGAYESSTILRTASDSLLAVVNLRGAYALTLVQRTASDSLTGAVTLRGSNPESGFPRTSTDSLIGSITLRGSYGP